MEQISQYTERSLPDRKHPISSKTVHLQAWMLGAVCLLALGLRLLFIFHVSTIPVIWDAELYWNLALKIRNLICADLGYCISTSAQITWAEAIRSVTISREGLAPVVFGAFLTVLPNDPKSIYSVLAIMDSLVCLMTMKIVLRLGGPVWASALTGCIYATYIPVVVGAGAFLQQPFIRFWLMAAVYAYTLALTSSDDREARRFYMLGAVASVALGFSSTTSRPLLWIGPVVTALISFCSDRPPHMRKRLTDAVTLVVLLASIFAVTRALVTDVTSFNLAAVITTGLPIDRTGSDQIQMTVLSFQDFWPPSDWYPNNVPFHTKSLDGDFLGSPGVFVWLWIYSIFGNWVYPDHLYFQAFILNLGQQDVQHLIVVILGIAGLSCMLGSRGPDRKIAFLIAVFLIFVSLTNAVISVEPRRLSVLAPFWSIGLGYCAWVMCSSRGSRLVGVAVLTAISVALWRLPVAILLYVPVSTEAAFDFLMAARLASVLVLVWYLIQTWQQSRPAFSRAMPLVAMSGCVAIVAIACFQDSDWRTWSTVVSTKIRQTVTRTDISRQLWPWLLLDVDPEHAASLSISINGELVKEAGVPMQIWEAGVPPSWQPYAQRSAFANTKVSRAMWSAIPIPEHLTAANTFTVELDAAGRPFSIHGDLADRGDPRYSGPLFDPWVTGHSMWRWIWNASDPRIPRIRTLSETYVSARYDGRSWEADDLSPGFGRQSGRFRIFIADAAFGPGTNALRLPLAENPLPECRTGTLIAAAGKDLPYICQLEGGALDYFIEGNFMGRSRHQALVRAAPYNEVIERLDSLSGHVEIVKVLNTTFVANFYSTDSALLYSLAFRTGQ